MTPTDPAYASQLRSLLRMSADDLDRTAAAWEATATNDHLHAPPAMIVHAATTAQAHRAASAIIRRALAELDAPPVRTFTEVIEVEERPYTRDDILYVLVQNDAEAYLEQKLGDDEDPAEALEDEFADLVRHVIDGDPGWGERFEACCDVAWGRLVEAHPELEESSAGPEEVSP